MAFPFDLLIEYRFKIVSRMHTHDQEKIFASFSWYRQSRRYFRPVKRIEYTVTEPIHSYLISRLPLFKRIIVWTDKNNFAVYLTDRTRFRRNVQFERHR